MLQPRQSLKIAPSSGAGKAVTTNNTVAHLHYRQNMDATTAAAAATAELMNDGCAGCMTGRTSYDRPGNARSSSSSDKDPIVTAT